MSEAINQAEPPTETKPSRLRKLALLLVPLVFFAGLAGIFLKQLNSDISPSLVPSPFIGKPAPGLELPALTDLLRDGRAVAGLSRADLMGHVTLVNIWASWCAPCREEHPVLEAIAKDSRIRLVGINYKDRPADARRFLGQFGNPYVAVGVDASGRTSIDWGAYGVPETFLVGPDGTIRYKFIGPLSPRSFATVLAPEIEKALAVPAAGAEAG